MDYIRRQYGVPARRGGRVRYKGKPGTITGSFDAHLRIRLDGEKYSRCYHPTWEVQYETSMSLVALGRVMGETER